MTHEPVTVIGGGLAGSEAAWQVARRGLPAVLFEMRPQHMTPAHRTGLLAELVCSNSLGSALADRATGVLQAEMRLAGSLVMRAADEARTPAGGALAVARETFAEAVTRELSQSPFIEIRREEVKQLPKDGITVVATGPLTSDALAGNLARETGDDNLHFFDAIAPIVSADSLNRDICFRASRYGRGDAPEGDYLNCPMTQEEYERFVEALRQAETIPLDRFETEDPRFFEGCLPVEEIARRGPRSLAFGPLRPVGLTDPRTGKRPYAVVQLRQDDQVGTLYNMVGFQTNLRYPEQKRVFRMIPGMEKAEFVRLGQMHRNTFLNAPKLLEPTLRMKQRPRTFLAGQLAGVEGYMGNVATGWLAGVNAARTVLGDPLLHMPPTTLTGALTHYICGANAETFQPMKANFALVPPLPEAPRKKRLRAAAYGERAVADFAALLSEHNIEAMTQQR